MITWFRVLSTEAMVSVSCVASAPILTSWPVEKPETSATLKEPAPGAVAWASDVCSGSPVSNTTGTTVQ